MYSAGFPANLIQVKSLYSLIPMSGAVWPDGVADLGHDNCEQDYARTFTSASLREAEITDGLDAGRKPSTRLFER